MIPVLQVKDPAAACDMLIRLFGFVPRNGRLALGLQEVLVTGSSEPEGLIAFPFDHLAIRVSDVDATLGEALARGAELDPAFTPDGPREIAAFGASGMRYGFCRGPEGWPLEFCAPRQPEGGFLPRHDHSGWRVADFETALTTLASRGARLAARHRLGAVSVGFLPWDDCVCELFDEPAPTAAPSGGGWIGFVA